MGNRVFEPSSYSMARPNWSPTESMGQAYATFLSYTPVGYAADKLFGDEEKAASEPTPAPMSPSTMPTIVPPAPTPDLQQQQQSGTDIPWLLIVGTVGALAIIGGAAWYFGRRD